MLNWDGCRPTFGAMTRPSTVGNAEGIHSIATENDPLAALLLREKILRRQQALERVAKAYQNARSPPDAAFRSRRKSYTSNWTAKNNKNIHLAGEEFNLPTCGGPASVEGRENIENAYVAPPASSVLTLRGMRVSNESDIELHGGDFAGDEMPLSEVRNRKGKKSEKHHLNVIKEDKVLDGKPPTHGGSISRHHSSVKQISTRKMPITPPRQIPVSARTKASGNKDVSENGRRRQHDRKRITASRWSRDSKAASMTSAQGESHTNKRVAADRLSRDSRFDLVNAAQDERPSNERSSADSLSRDPKTESITFMQGERYSSKRTSADRLSRDSTSRLDTAAKSEGFGNNRIQATRLSREEKMVPLTPSQDMLEYKREKKQRQNSDASLSQGKSSSSGSPFSDEWHGSCEPMGMKI